MLGAGGEKSWKTQLAPGFHEDGLALVCIRFPLTLGNPLYIDGH